MFKFKMSLFLQSTKFKVALVVLLIATILTGIVIIPKNKASNLSQSVTVTANPTGVTLSGNTIYTIKKVSNSTGYDNLYCIDEGGPLTTVTYSNPVELMNGSTEQFFTNYKAAVWLVNNMYVSNATGLNGASATDAQIALAMNIAHLTTCDEVKSKVASTYGIDVSSITAQKVFYLKDKYLAGDNALETVEQLALWNFTKNRSSNVSALYRNNPNLYFSNTGLSTDEQKTLKYFYYALITLGQDNTVTSATATVNNPVNLNSNKAVYNKETKKAGPYYLEENGKTLTDFGFGNSYESRFPVVAEITNTDGSVSKAGAEIFEKTADGAIYVNLANYPNAKTLNFRIQYVPKSISTYAYVLYGGGNQNLLGVEKSIYVSSLTGKIDVPQEEKKEKTGKYYVILNKVEKDGKTVITSSEATFKVNGKDVQTTKGVLNIALDKTIANTEQVDTYEITETKAPEGYTKFDGTMKVSVKFKENDTNYIIDKENTVIEGFTNGANIEVSPEKSTITINVPNEKETKSGEFNVQLYKVDKDGNLINTPAKFNVNGNEVTTANGKADIASEKNIKDESTVREYTIKEVEAPENYNMFNGSINLKVKMSKVDNQIVLKQDGITFDYQSEGNLKPTMQLDGSTIKIYVPNEHKEFDLSLRKFITKIDGKAVETSREPDINIQSIRNLIETGTASYYHTKNSLTVTVGSEVEYTIRVYNEGEILGYTKQITDYLPEGLSFVRIADESKNQYSTTSEVGSKVVVLNYNGNTEIKTLRDFFKVATSYVNKAQINVTNEYYQEVKIICKVENTSAKYITSRSEITNYGYYENNEWKEAKEIGKVDRDSVQNTIKNSLSLNTWYENAKERTYSDANGNTVVDKNYYPGVQDDDDFETVEVLSGKYNIIIKKVDSKDHNKVLEGAYFSINGSNNVNKEVGPTGSNGEATLISNVDIKNDKQVDTYTIKETKAPKNYKSYNGEIKLTIGTKYDQKTFVIDQDKTTVNGKGVEYSLSKNNTTLTIIVPDEQKEFDLSLRKFITEVNGKKPEVSREPQVDVTKLASKESTTATYNHPKNPLDVNPTDIVTYTIRVYNEGEIDGYANKIMDDIPEGLEFLPENETNKQYKWVMYKEAKSGEKTSSENTITYNNKTYVVTQNAKEADLIVTEFLSMENGKENLIKAFDSASKKLDYKDVKVSFKVVEPETSDRILINYAQITDDKDLDGREITDRDSTTNVWIDDEDDQDIEKVKVRYFDLALRKWVTKAIVYENGNKTVTETNHSPWDDPEDVVKVDLKDSELDKVEVKFEYSIRVINQGEIAGYAKEISDYIPEGLKFVPGDNPQWVETDGKVVTKALENTLLQPGEYADVTIVLTWINGNNNLGLKTNVAEISKDYNDYGVKDIDSTPNNQVPGEDDIDDAPVILVVRTGAPIVYTGIAISIIAVLSLGVIIVRKKILERQ